MGWPWPFSSSSPAPKTPQATGTPPDRSTRQKCYTSRDAFFSCLDSHAIVDPSSAHPSSSSSKKQSSSFSTTTITPESKKLCGKEFEMFEQDCLGSWVDYFLKLRVRDWKKARLLEKMEREGAERMGGVGEVVNGK